VAKPRSNPEPMNLDSYSAGAWAVAPVAVVIGVIAVVFGVLARGAGLSPAATIVMSATTFAGSAQFAVISVIASGGAISTAVTTASLMNARYTLIGSHVAPKLHGGSLRRFVLAQLTVDESWGVASMGSQFSERRLIGAGLVLFTAHVGCTAVGAFGGARIADPTEWGLDAAFPALFVILLLPHIRRREGLIAAGIGAAAALLMTPITPPGVPLLGAVATSIIGCRTTDPT
jgi:predicted branched-subunit amino acid permease